MKKAVLICLSDKTKVTLFQNCQIFILINPPPPGRLLARQRSENSTPGAPRMCEFPRGRPGEGMVRLGID